MRLLKVLLCFVLLSGPALADVYADCQSAIEAGDKAKAETLSQLIFQLKAVALSRQAIGAACISFAKGEEYVYQKDLRAFVDSKNMPTHIQAAEKLVVEREAIREAVAEKLKEANAVAHAKTVTEVEAAALAQKAKASEAMRKLQAAEAASEAAKAAAEAAKAAKIQVVWTRLMKACTELYQDDPTEAMTRQVCFDLFLVTGLPSE